MNNLVCLCGSTRFMADFIEANIELTKRGLSGVTVSMCLPKNEQGDEKEAALKELLDLIHLNKILRSDAIFVIGDGYIGRSTAREILWADMHGKPIIAWRDCHHNWETAANNVKHGSCGTDIVPKARKVLGL